MATRRTILVTGGTGQQGGAVARSLLGKGQNVRVMARRPDKAQELQRMGAEVVRGDFDDPESIREALRGVQGVFIVSTFAEKGVEAESEQGMVMVRECRKAGVPHVVYTSVCAAEKHTGIPHFESKARVERAIDDAGQPATILRPVWFMENWRNYYREPILAGTLSLPLDPGRPLQQVCVDDIGAFGAMAFAHPDRWLRRELDLAGDELTLPQVAETLSEATGAHVAYSQVSWDEFGRTAGADSLKMFRWFSDVGYSANIPALRKEYPGLKRLADCLPVHGWQRVEELVGAESR